MEGEESFTSGCFSNGQSAQEYDQDQVYPSSDSRQADLPVIDLASLRGSPSQRSATIHKIHQACCTFGIFQVVNHGIDQAVLDRAIAAADGFFRVPAEERLKFMSSDVHTPVRYDASLKEGADNIPFWRMFLKTYANPLKDWIQTWPKNPRNYREDMGDYSTEVRKLAVELGGAITESLCLGPNYLTAKMDEGMQVVALNYYPPCPQPGLILGIAPHTDHSCLTILLQSRQGLEIMETEAGGSWKLVSDIKGALQVHIGDHFEVLSNGVCKSAVHRATLYGEETRISIGSFHSLGMDEIMEPASELVDEDHPKAYKGSSFRDFLNFLSTKDTSQGKISFLDTLRIK